MKFMERAAYRIIDANFNRAREALRMMEEFARFSLNSPHLSSRAKNLRHELCATVDRLGAGRLIASRDTLGDVGTNIKPENHSMRTDITDCAAAACRRLSEALRALEETIQTLEPAGAANVANLRYSAYTLEKDLLLAGSAREKFKSVRLYVIIGDGLPIDIIRLAQICAKNGADCIQLRLKKTDDEQTFALAAEMVATCKNAGIISIINDRVDIAVAAGADGVHLGQNDLPLIKARKLQLSPLIFGKSTHSITQLKEAVEQGADYVSLGPVFSTGTKPGLAPVGLEYVTQAVELASEAGISHVAIGGVTLNNIDLVLKAGAVAVAVHSAICQSQDPAEVCRRFKHRLTN